MSAVTLWMNVSPFHCFHTVGPQLIFFLFFQSLKDFKLQERQEDGRGKCSFDPAQSFTTVMVGELTPYASGLQVPGGKDIVVFLSTGVEPPILAGKGH